LRYRGDRDDVEPLSFASGALGVVAGLCPGGSDLARSSIRRAAVDDRALRFQVVRCDCSTNGIRLGAVGPLHDEEVCEGRW